MCIAFVYFASCDVIDFEINRFPAWPKKSGQKFKYLRNEKIFLQALVNYNFSHTKYRARKTALSVRPCIGARVVWGGRGEGIAPPPPP